MPRLLWIVRRLAAMSAGELATRLVREARHAADDVAYRAARPLWERSWAAPATSGERPLAPVGLLTRERAALVAQRDPEGASAIVAAAEGFAAGNVAYFGYEPVKLEGEDVFVRDPHTGGRWPDRHGKRLDYRGASFGDPKWIWELSRLQELPLLAQAWLLSGRDEFAEAALGHARHFLTVSPPGRGIAWSNGFEAGLRVTSLSLFLDSLRGSPLLGRKDERMLLAALWQHRRWIKRDPSTHSSANNHLLGELSGLVVVSLLAPELEGSEPELERALATLCREAELQIAADGSGAEQSFTYSLEAVDHLLLVAALLEATGRETPYPLRAALERSADALSVQLGPGEPPPTYGDTDDGRVVRLDGDPLRDPRAVAAALAAYLGHPGARGAAERVTADALWLFGEKGAARWERTEPAPPPGSALLPDAGLAVLRQGRRRLLFDAGPLGYLSIAAHGHADALAIALSEGEEELVVDPGTGSYFRRPELRRAFRSTAMHATVVVDGEDQSVQAGPFLWTDHARARFLDVDLAAGAATGEHEGYERLQQPVRHRRSVLLAEVGPVVVHDHLHGRGRHRLVQSWPLAPALELEALEGSVARFTRRGSPRLAIAVASTGAGELLATRGQADPVRGWYSPRLEAVEPAWHVTWEAEAEHEADVVALLWPLDGETWPQPQLEARTEGHGVRVTFEGPDGPLSLFLGA